MKRLIRPLLALALTGSAAQAASFDCKKANSPPEKAVCADALLSELDGHLGRYFAAASEALKDGATCLKADQREWVKTVRDACGAKSACLKTAYLERLGTLDGLQPGASAIKTIELPAMPQLAAAIPPEAEAAVSGAKQNLSITGVLLHEQDDLYQMGYAVRPSKRQVRAFVLEMEIGNSVNHETVASMIEHEAGRQFTVRGMAAADGNFASDKCRFVFRH